MLGQSVLLRGVNDTAEALEALFRAMLAARVKPYYLHQLDPAPGTARFHVPIEEGRRLLAQLRGRVTGLAWPTYVLDIPGGYGKVPIGPDYLEPDDRVRDPQGTRRPRRYATASHGGIVQAGIHVDVGQPELDVDLGHPQHVGFGQDAGIPIVAVTDEHRGGDAVLLKDHVALNRRRGLVLAQLLDPVGARGAWAEDLEHDDGLGNDGVAWSDLRAAHIGVRIADVALHLDLGGRPPRSARLTVEDGSSEQRAQSYRRWLHAGAFAPVIATGWNPSNS